MKIQTEHLTLVLQTPAEVLASLEEMTPADRAEVSPDWIARVRVTTHADPWSLSFSMVHQASGAVIGGCGYKGPPDADAVVEIAYGVDPAHRGQGYATEAARALVTYAFASGKVRRVRAHTLPDPNASTRVLTKCGFEKLGEVIDPEDGLVWRWEILPTPGSRAVPNVTDHPQPSRRDFLAASAIGILGLVSPRPTSPNREASPPDGELLYVGTYTEDHRAEGIHLVRMDPRSGELRRVGAVRAGANPSFLALHPNGRVLYAVNEVTELDGKPTGAVSAFAVAADTGDLTLLNTQHSHGGAPCYVSVDRRGRIVLVANYMGGNVASLPIQSSGALGVATQVVQHQGRGLNAERQEAPHAHCIIADRSNRFALVADLGIDRVLVYRLADDGTLRRTGGDAVLQGGAGPRHLAFHPTQPIVFVANELDSTVAVLHFEAERGGLLTTQTLSALPAGWRGTSFAADIHLDPAGRSLYVSNRGHNSIAVFSVADATGALALEQTISTAGDWPRNFSIDPSGRWLLVANQRSGSIVVFARDQESGRLTPTPHRLEVASPVCLRFSR